MRLRLFLSFALITIITLAILSFVVQGQTQSTLTTFAKGGGFFGADRIVNQLEDYYLEHGSWEGVSSEITSSGSPDSNNQSAGQQQNSQGQGTGATQGRGNSRGGYMYMGGQGMIGNFSLTDPEGQVIFSNTTDLVDQFPVDVLEDSFPINVDNQLVGYVVPDNNIIDLGEIISENLKTSLNESLLKTVLISGGVALVLALIFAYVLMRPVRRLTSAASQLAQGDLSQRVPVQGGAELSQLAKTFNQMAESLEKSYQARKAMTADIAHELRNPLAVQRANLEAIQDGVYPLTLDNLEPIIQQNNLLNKLVEDLRTLTLTDTDSLSLDKTATDFAPFIQQICEHVQPQFSANQINLQFAYSGNCPKIAIDKNRMNQVIYNLLQNSLHHTPSGGKVVLTLSCSASTANLSIHDSGVGIPEEALPQIFERFYRADHSRSRDKGGTGLGLTIALRLVEAHHGTLTAANHPNGGAVFTIRLPIGESK
ncbi:MAG: ATP-binding protein [Anaerolineales bacterium]